VLSAKKRRSADREDSPLPVWKEEERPDYGQERETRHRSNSASLVEDFERWPPSVGSAVERGVLEVDDIAHARRGELLVFRANSRSHRLDQRRIRQNTCGRCRIGPKFIHGREWNDDAENRVNSSRSNPIVELDPSREIRQITQHRI
jgi:hypothetical protein